MFLEFKRSSFSQIGLHYACEEGESEICRLLLESGAKIDVPNREGLTPAQVKYCSNISQNYLKLILWFIIQYYN